MNDNIDELVRDACSAVPVSKSEFKRRILALLQLERDKAIDDCLKVLPAEEKHPTMKTRLTDDRNRGWNAYHDEAAEAINSLKGTNHE